MYKQQRTKYRRYFFLMTHPIEYLEVKLPSFSIEFTRRDGIRISNSR